MIFDYVRVACAIPSVQVANCMFNSERIKHLISQAEKQGVDVVCFPELSITAYTCQDLFAHKQLLEKSYCALSDIVRHSAQFNIIIIVGIPIDINTTILNCAAVIQKGEILGIVPKTYLPNYKEFYEKRWFSSADILKDGKSIKIEGKDIPISSKLIFENKKYTFGIEICEDLWAPIPPSSYLALNGADIIFNLSADNEIIGKYNFLKNLISQQSARCISGYVYTSCGFGESSQDLVFTGNALVYENGNLLIENNRFSIDEQLVITDIDIDKLRHERRTNTTFSKNISLCDPLHYETIATQEPKKATYSLQREINAFPFIPKKDEIKVVCHDIIETQVLGLAQRLRHIHCQNIVIGISGGLDSTLALLIGVKTFDKLGLNRKNIIGVTMPGFGTSNRTYTNAVTLMNLLGVDVRDISICESVTQHFKDIGHDPSIHNTTYENGQARERTQILMDIANQTNAIVVGTGDLSELALGWATYNGDHMSMYNVNVSIPKTLIKSLVQWFTLYLTKEESRVLLDIIDTPISPELIPGTNGKDISQKTEELVGPYELHDFFLYHFIRWGARPAKIMFLAQQAFGNKYEKETIKKWLTIFFKRFFQQQFKRSCLPDGPKVGSCSLSPRGDWRMASDCSPEIWIEDCNKL